MMDSRAENASQPATEEPRFATPADEEAILWRDLVAADDLETLAAAWLQIQCGTLEGAHTGIVAVVEEDGRSLALVSTWPEEMRVPANLVQVAERAVAEKRGVARKPTDDDARSSLAYPVLIDGSVHGVVALQLSSGNGLPLGGAMRQLQWGTAWIRDRLRHERFGVDSGTLQRVTSTLDIVATSLQREKFADACQATVTELARQLDCERVSIGLVKGDHAKVAAISHSAQFGKRMNLVRKIEAAMDESIDQRIILCTPLSADGPPLTTQAHESLSKSQNAANVLTVPLTAADEYVGAMVFERPENLPFDQSTIDVAAASAALLGPVLREKRLNDRWLVVKAWDLLSDSVHKVFGPDHVASKLIALGVFLAFLFAWFATGTYRVSGDARIEGAVQRVVVASFDGYIKEAPARAGDIVNEGDLLVYIDDRDLALERLSWVTDRQEKQFELERALSERNRAEVNVFRTQIAKAEAQIELIDESLSRARILAPFDGVVVSGDLSQSIGATTQRGEVLFEVAPLRQYRVVVFVGEDQVEDVHLGQRGDLVVTALPDRELPVVITKITPVAESLDGKNTFRIEAELEGASIELRPGMEGVAKLDVDERRLVWIWTRQLRNWIRLTAWRWFG